MACTAHAIHERTKEHSGEFKMTNLDQVKDAIKQHLAACEPCTLEQLMEEIEFQCDIHQSSLLPTIITALAELMEKGIIYEYEERAIDHPFEFSWVLSQEASDFD